VKILVVTPEVYKDEGGQAAEPGTAKRNDVNNNVINWRGHELNMGKVLNNTEIRLENGEQ
jgi:hypothetical protein